MGDYLEMKRLGKLFDEWKMQQDATEEETDYQQQKEQSSRFGRPFQSMPANQHVSNDRTSSSSASPRKGRRLRPADACHLGQHRNVDRSIEEEEALVHGSEHSSDRGEQHGTRKLATKLFQAITNPKVTGEAVSDSTENTSHVEGFPALSLMQLHQGPWKLDASSI